MLEWDGETLRLPALPDRSVTAATLLDGTGLGFRQHAGELAITVPAGRRDPVDTIIELTMDRPVDGLPPIAGAPDPR